MSVADAIEEFCTQLRRRHIEGPLVCAKRTAEIMRVVVARCNHADADALIDDLRKYGSKIQAAKPIELAIGNVVRRVLHLVREEAQHEVADDTHSTSAVPQPQVGLLSQALRKPIFSRALSLSNLLEMEPGIGQQLSSSNSCSLVNDADSASTAAKKKARGASQWAHKHNVIESINELIDEFDNIQAAITAQAVEHIHANEVIMTLGMSETTHQFLKEAAKKREFQVVVAEGAPRYDGHQMAVRLADTGIQATLIPDAAIFAMMARANKVLIGAHAVLANGGVIAPVGTHMLALAARRHSIPLVVLVGLHKLSPLFLDENDTTSMNDFAAPSDTTDLDILAEVFEQQRRAEEAGVDPTTCGTVDCPNPYYDYIPPHLVSLFVTDTGGYTPSYVYRLLTEYYSREDYVLSKDLSLGGRRDN